MSKSFGLATQDQTIPLSNPTVHPANDCQELGLALGEKIQVAVYRGVEGSSEWHLELLEPALTIHMSLAAELEPNFCPGDWRGYQIKNGVRQPLQGRFFQR